MAGWLSQRIGAIVLRGPSAVVAERGADAQGALLLAARHDGYAARFGVLHERRWRLSQDEAGLTGEDAFLPGGKGRKGGMRRAPVAIRFHLHPSVRATRSGERTVRLAGAACTWEFSAQAGTLALEESVFFAALDGARRTEQIVLRLVLEGETRVDWAFRRVAA